MKAKPAKAMSDEELAGRIYAMQRGWRGRWHHAVPTTPNFLQDGKWLRAARMVNRLAAAGRLSPPRKKGAK